MVLLVDRDLDCGQAIAAVLRRSGDVVHVVRNRSQALQLLRRWRFTLAIIDLFVDGGGLELAREISRQVPQVMLCLGASMPEDELLEAALGFPVHRKSVLPELLRDPFASSNGGASAATPRGSRRPLPVASEPSPAPGAHARGRQRRSH
jgi:CheY-like chemotaxis protein